MLSRVLGTSRFLIALAVAGSFVTAAALMVFGLLSSLALVADVLQGPAGTDEASKELIVDAVSVIDIFLLGTVLYIISAGLYQLFVDDALRLPRWLIIESLDDLKARLTGVIVVGLLVAFLGYVIEWKGGVDLLAPGLGIAAIIVAAGIYFRLTHHPVATYLPRPGVPVGTWVDEEAPDAARPAAVPGAEPRPAGEHARP